MKKEQIAKAAATQWCRCHKCDGIVRNLVCENAPAIKFQCNKEKLETCHKWYNGYRAALLALSMKELNK